MGYTTDFEGSFTLNQPLTEAHAAYLKAFAGTRRMHRDAVKTALIADPVRAAVNLPVGKDGGFFVGNTANVGQDKTDDIIEYNDPPKGQPGLWCQWVPTASGDSIEWDGGEKFNEYTAWLEYIVTNFLQPWGYVLNGKVKWYGEERSDTGTISVKNNVVKTTEPRY